MSETNMAPEVGWKYDTDVKEDQADDGGWLYAPETGLTVRDMFAYGALEALLEPHDPVSQYGQIAEMAYSMADAMMAERAKTFRPCYGKTRSRV